MARDELGESRFSLNVMGELRVVIIGPSVPCSRLIARLSRCGSAGFVCSVFAAADHP